MSDTSHKNQLHTDEDISEAALADEIPSTARQGGRNNVATVLGFAVIAAAAALMIWWVNFREAPPAKAPERETNSRMPPLPDVALPTPRAVPDDNIIVEDPYDDALKRRMSGNVVAGGGSGSGSKNSRPARGTTDGPQSDIERLAYLQHISASSANDANAIASRGRLAGQLDPTVTETVKAGVLPNRNFVLAKGSTLDCVLETAIDSTVPGITTCQLTRDIYSDNGKVLLLDRGSQLVGEYSGELRQGQARMFMLWTRARTPNGVVVNLDSPAIDELGRSGVDGHIDTFFWKRFGAAILMSVLSDSIDASRKSGNSIYLNNTGKAAEKVVESMLQQQANIRPRLVRNQGTRIQVMVARDLDFSEVYALKHNLGQVVR